MKYCLMSLVSTADPAGRLSACGYTRHNLQNPRRRDCREIIAIRINNILTDVGYANNL